MGQADFEESRRCLLEMNLGMVDLLLCYTMAEVSMSRTRAEENLPPGVPPMSHLE